MRAIWPAVAVSAAVLALGAGSGAGSDGLSGVQAGTTIPAGFDLFETDPEQTVFRFQGQTQIPAGFFTDGSEPFTGDVAFGGVPIERFRGKATGDADTVVQRRSAATVPADGSPGAPIPIELVRLSLVSVAPIQVVVGQQTQLWDVRAEASPTRPSGGSMRMAAPNPAGGVFDSQLTVYPKFTFTRLSDRQQQTLDVGALPDGQRPDTPLQANNTPWRAGCVPPALLVKGLNDGFCPGLTPARNIVLTVEQAPQARHGVRPAQPMLEHFKCYSGNLAEGSKFTERLARLTDQFGESVVEVKAANPSLCNPVRKNKEPFSNTKAHLYCYTTTAKVPDGPPRVFLHNQFGSFAATLRTAESVCVPSTKQLAGQKKPKGVVFTDHFQCYGIKREGTFTKDTVTLKDQFESVKVSVKNPIRLCAPVQKNDEKAEHPVQHLVCYLVRGLQFQEVTTIRNQYGRQKFIAKRGRELCVPTIKVRG